MYSIKNAMRRLKYPMRNVGRSPGVLAKFNKKFERRGVRLHPTKGWQFWSVR